MNIASHKYMAPKLSHTGKPEEKNTANEKVNTSFSKQFPHQGRENKRNSKNKEGTQETDTIKNHTDSKKGDTERQGSGDSEKRETHCR